MQFSVRRVLDPLNVTSTDLLLSMAIRLFREVTDQSLISRRRRALIGDALLDDVYRWFTQEIILEKIIEPQVEIGRSANVNLLFAKLEGKVATEAATRRTIRERLEYRVSELVGKMDQVIAEAQKETDRRVLIVVGDIDKLDLEAARSLFVLHATSLNAPQAYIVYTFPVALRNDSNWNHIKGSCSNRLILPNIRLRDFNGRPDDEGSEVMRRLVLNRMEPSLILSDALDLAVGALCVSGTIRSTGSTTGGSGWWWPHDSGLRAVETAPEGPTAGRSPAWTRVVGRNAPHPMLAGALRRGLTQKTGWRPSLERQPVAEIVW